MPEQTDHAGYHDDEDAKGHGRPLDDQLHNPGIAFRQAGELFLELPEKPVFLTVLGFQQNSRHGGGERQGHNSRKDDGNGDGDGELLVKLSRDAAEKSDGNEDGA